MENSREKIQKIVTEKQKKNKKRKEKRNSSKISAALLKLAYNFTREMKSKSLKKERKQLECTRFWGVANSKSKDRFSK